MKHSIIEDSNVEVLKFFSEISKTAKKEKLSTIALNQMMSWWTRKPLIVGRAIILSCLFDNLSDVRQFVGLDSPRPYAYKSDTKLFEQKLGVNPKSIAVLDPFGGSGNLAFPSVQLGLDVTVSDYNPVAWLIERGALEYSTIIQEDFLIYANEILEETKKMTEQYFDDSQLTYLWCWCIRCPYCTQRFPLTNHMYIVKTSKKKIGIKIIPKNNDFTIEIVDNISDEDGCRYTQKGGKAVCPSCTNTIQYEVMTEYIAKHRDREMIVVQTQTATGREYKLPSASDKKRHHDAKQYFESRRAEFERDDIMPTENILASHRIKNTLWNYGITKWDEYFDERQLLVLCTFMQNIKKICSRIPDDSYRRIINTYVAFVLGKRVDNAGFGVGWVASSTSPAHVLAMRQPRISYNFAESNPFVKISGSIVNIIQSISKSIKFAQQRLSNTATCKNESVTRASDKQYDIIITDPPYGDDVQYGELSEFFYVWMRRVLDYDDLPSRIPLDEGYCESQGRFGDREKARAFFGYGLERSFKMMNRKLKDDGLLVVLFAHSTTGAWNQFFTALQKAKLSVVSSYAVHTELSTNVLARGKTSFMSSIMVTCRKITVDSVRYYEDLIPEIDDGISKILDDIGDTQLLDLSITDLIIMVYGKVLEKSTQHTTLKSYEKDRKPDFETLLANARSTIIKQLVEKLLKKQSDIVGPQMSFYVINKIFNNGAISSDDALKIVQTYNTTLPALSTDGVITQKKDEVVRLEGLKRVMDYAPDEIDSANLHQQLCYLVSHPQNVAQLLHHDNINTNLLKDVVEVLIKNYHNKRQKGQSPDDKEEVRILENIADHMGISTSSSYNYSGRDVKKTHQRDRKSMRDEAQSHLEQWK